MQHVYITVGLQRTARWLANIDGGGERAQLRSQKRKEWSRIQSTGGHKLNVMGNQSDSRSLDKTKELAGLE